MSAGVQGGDHFETLSSDLGNGHDGQFPRVAYFSMEFGLHEELPIYAGGLGILAGDMMKSAGDLKMPVVGIGILWMRGYTYQLIGENGWPYDTYPEIQCNCLQETGVTVHLSVRGRNLACKVWKVDKYGNAPLYLLDTHLPENEDPWITDYLYGGQAEDRVAQEMVLGIGGIRALRALNLPIDVYHFNEGHAALAGIELIREKMNEGKSFEDAWAATRRQIVFTTHTPVMAGNESHEIGLLRYMGALDGLSDDQVERIGGNPFGMTGAGLALSRLANGVAKLHGQTARKMWEDVENASPILSVTNGVHGPTWQDARIRQALESGGDLWETHQTLKRELLDEVRERTGVQLNPDGLLIGFARRAAPYKRSDLILRRPDVIDPMLDSGQLQLIFSGKAHPHDDCGKRIVSQLVHIANRHPHAVVFLENYNMHLGRLLTRGCDVWLNNPQRPLEASGTSGMKAAMNGVLNCSVLDGWWPEGCKHGENGWQIGGGYEGLGQEQHDLVSLYEVLLDEIVPTYYENRSKWINMMRASIEMSQWQFSSDRMLKEYYKRMYAPVPSVVIERVGWATVAVD